MTTPTRYELREHVQVYDRGTKRHIAVCSNSSDAELVVSALNSAPGLRDLVKEMQQDRDRYLESYGPPQRYEGS